MSAVESYAARILTRDNPGRSQEFEYLFSTEANAQPHVEELRGWARTYLLQNFSATVGEEQHQNLVRAFARAHHIADDLRSPLYTQILRIQGKYYLPVSDGDLEGIYNYFGRLAGVKATAQGYIQFLRDLA